jgi:hypothetical protein
MSRSAAVVFVLGVLSGCGGSGSTHAGTAGQATVPGTPTFIQSAPAGTSLASAGRDRLWNCAGGNVEVPDRPWVSQDGRVDVSKRPVIAGAEHWRSQLQLSWVDGHLKLSLSGNGLPATTSGSYPITAQEGEIYRYYVALGESLGFPKSQTVAPMRVQNFHWTEGSNGGKLTHPSCVPAGPIGVLSTGTLLWSALEAKTIDFTAGMPADRCFGTVAPPPQLGMYHFHSFSPCLDTGPKNQASPVLGYIFDGFPITGPRGPGGRLLTNEDLDECHGTTSTIDWQGRPTRMYHYVFNYQFPYSVGCFRGPFSVRDSNLFEPPHSVGGPSVRPRYAAPTQPVANPAPNAKGS